jgi:hypothetical protein
MRRRWWLGIGAVGLVLALIAGLVGLNHGTGGSTAGSAGPPAPAAGGQDSGSPDIPSQSPTSPASPFAAASSPKPSASASASTPVPAPGGTVYFQDIGDVRKWSNYPQQPQKAGIIRNVTTPSYRGGTTIEARQTYMNQGGGYHSEVIQAGVEHVGEDRYYGQAIYLPPTWQFTHQLITFQQFSPENPDGPWELMIIQDDGIRIGGSGGIEGAIGKITNLRGTWIRIVIRFKLAATGGAIEVWFNGVKTLSLTNRTVLPKTSPTIRWSSGIYCQSWRSELPAGPTQISIFHSHARIASSYPLAEPANW